MQSNSLLVRLYVRLREKKVFFIYIPLAVYWIVLFILTTIPTDAIPQFFNTQDKLEHFTGYFVLSVLLCLTLHFQKKNIQLSKYSVLIAFLLIISYGAVDELHQLFIPGRTADITDWLADSIGAGFGILLCSRFIKTYLLKKGEKLLPD